MSTIIRPPPNDQPANRQWRLNRTNRNGHVGHYSGRELSEKVLEAIDRKPITPQHDVQSIRTTAISSGRAGESNVRDMAARAYGAANVELREEIHELIEQVQEAKKGAQRHVREISDEMGQMERYIRTRRNGTPWTLASRVKLWFFIVLSFLLLGVGINTNAVVLMSSGIATFENPLRAYLFSAIPIGLAAAIKAIGSLIECRQNRSYTIGVWVVGFLFGLVWAKLFAASFPGVAQSASDIVRSLTDSALAQSSRPSSGVFVFFAIAAESFLAAGCWLTAQALFERHELDESIDNPAYLKLQSDLDSWSKAQNEHSQLLGRLTGRIQAMEDAEHHYVDQAVNYFRAALKWATNNEHLEDFLES